MKIPQLILLILIWQQSTPAILQGPPPCNPTKVPTHNSPCTPPSTGNNTIKTADPDRAAIAQHQFFEDRFLVKSFGRALIDAYPRGRMPSADEKKSLRKQAQLVERSLPRIVTYIGGTKLSSPTKRVATPIDVLNELLPALRHVNDGLDSIAATPVIDVATNQQLIETIQQLKELLTRFK